MTESLGRMAVGGGGAGDSYSSPTEQYKITPLSTTQDSGQRELIKLGLPLQIIIITSITCQPTHLGKASIREKVWKSHHLAKMSFVFLIADAGRFKKIYEDLRLTLL